MHLLAVLKSVLVLLNMCNILELSGLFVYQGELVKISNAWVGQKKKCRVVVCYTYQYPGWSNGFSQIILFSFVSFFINWNLTLMEHCWRHILKCPTWNSLCIYKEVGISILFPLRKWGDCFVPTCLRRGKGAGIFFRCFGGGNKTCYDTKIVIFSWEWKTS